MDLSTKIALIVTIFLYFTTNCFSQEKPSSTLSFNYKSPRNGRPLAANDFINTVKPGPNIPGCYFTMATYRFRITQSMEIDSIALEGELLDQFTIPLQKQIKESQPYWQCPDCKHSQGHWISVPVYVSYVCARTCSSSDYPLFYKSREEYDSQFKGIPNGQLQLAENEWALALMYFSCIL